MNRGHLSLLVVLLAASVMTCSRKPGGPRHMAVLRFENLTGNVAFDWVGRGIARQIAAQLETSRTVRVTLADVPDAAGQRARAIVTGIPMILHGRLLRAGDRLRLTAELEDGVRKQFEPAYTAEGPLSAGVIPLADAIARKFDPGASRYATSSDAALASYIAGISTTDVAAAAAALDRAIAIDGKFVSPYLLRASLAMAQKNREGAAMLLDRARAQQSAFSEVDRLRLEAESAALRGDAAGRRRALIALSTLTPFDAALVRGLADSDLAGGQYSSAVELFKRAAVLDPRDPNVMNQLGYAQSYAGDLTGAIATLSAYERLQPQEANAPDSMGEVYFSFGRFAEAEQQYRRAFEKNPGVQNGNELMKAAQAHLMTGDVAGASSIFTTYAAARKSAGDKALPYWEAAWAYFSGNRKDAIVRMNALAGGGAGELASAARAQLAV
ncbi:MAG: tetratricopeptide repeat protein, partial [Bryobacteraceae bacterium]